MSSCRRRRERAMPFWSLCSAEQLPDEVPRHRRSFPDWRRSRGNRRWVYVRAPVEWYDLFQEWLATLPPADRSRYQYRFRHVLVRLDGNLYGRRTAGSVYQGELEEIMIGKFGKRFQFERGVKDPCVFRCKKTNVVLTHHIDDIRVAGPVEHLNCEVHTGSSSGLAPPLRCWDASRSGLRTPS